MKSNQTRSERGLEVQAQRRGAGKVMLGHGEEAEVVEKGGRELQRREQA